jgi:transposase-like protein
LTKKEKKPMERQGKQCNYYSEAFKQEIISKIESGKLTIEQARRIYNIGGSCTIQKWIKKYGRNHLLGKIVRIEMPEEVSELKKLQKQKAELESALAKAHLKILSLESIIEAAEEELGIELKKSSDKKQSSNPLKKEKPEQ